MTRTELKDFLEALKKLKVHPADTRWKWVKNQLKKSASK